MAAIFVKLYTALPIYRCKDLSNPSRIDRDAIFLKIFVIPGGNAPPHKFQQGDTSAPLPNRSGRYQGTTPTTWLNFNTPCKSQLKNAWPFSPTILRYARRPAVSAVSGTFFVRAVGAHLFGWRWVLVVRNVCGLSFSNNNKFGICIALHQPSCSCCYTSNIILDLTTKLRDRQTISNRVRPVPASAVPVKWCPEVRSTQRR